MCVVLCCVVLCCVALRCVVLCCVALRCVVLCVCVCVILKRNWMTGHGSGSQQGHKADCGCITREQLQQLATLAWYLVSCAVKCAGSDPKHLNVTLHGAELQQKQTAF